MKVTSMLRYFLGILTLSLLLAGCFDANHDRQSSNENEDGPSQPNTVQTEQSVVGEIPPLTIHRLADRWNSAAEQVLGDKGDIGFAGFQVSDSGESLTVHRSWGEEKNESFVKLTGYVDKENGIIERLFIHGKQADFSEEHLRHLQPYFEVLIAMSNPELSEDERSRVMEALSLDGDVAVLAERSEVDGNNTITVNDIRYDVAVISSSEGRTYALVATMNQECQGSSILSPCR